MAKRRKRRFNGSGCVYKMSGRRARPWVARVQVGKKDDGNPEYIYSFHETPEDAENAIPTMRINYNLNPKSEYTVSQIWEAFKAVRWGKLTESTKTGYEASYAHWGALHDRRIKDIKASDMQDIINSKIEMSFSHLSKMRSLMVALFNLAMKDDIVNKNYASLVELPKSEPESSRTSFTDEQLELIRKYKDKVPYADVVLFMCYTGWRPTEMSLLAPDSVDKENWIITGGIKTPSGKNRKVPVHPSIQPIVSDWLDKRQKTLFTDEKGYPLNKDTWATRFRAVMRAIFNDDSLVPYTTRHTCASILHAAGVDGVNIAKIMGHKDYKITANVYTHVQLEELRNAVDKLD